MSTNKIEMSLDDIIKGNRKSGGQRGAKKGAGIRKGKLGKKGVGGGKPAAGGKKPGNTVATKRLVQKLVKKALAQNGNAGGGRKNGRVVKVIRNASKSFRGVNRRSQIIKKGPRTETVVVQKIVKQRPQPRQQVVREVIVQEPVRQRIITQPARRFNNNRPKVVYVQESRGPQRSQFGGGFQRRRFQQQRRNFDPFYEPTNYLQRI